MAQINPRLRAISDCLVTVGVIECRRTVARGRLEQSFGTEGKAAKGVKYHPRTLERTGMSDTLDLNALRDRLHEAQQRHEDLPKDPSRAVTVDREGKIFLGQPRDNRPVSTVHQGLFA